MTLRETKTQKPAPPIEPATADYDAIVEDSFPASDPPPGVIKLGPAKPSAPPAKPARPRRAA